MKNDTEEKMRILKGIKPIEQLEKESKRNCIITGSVCIALGVLFASYTVNSYNYSTKIIGIIISALIMLLGIYYFSKKEIEKKRRELLKDENSWRYRMKQSAAEKKQRKWRDSSLSHGSLKHESSIKFRVVSGILTLVFFFLTAFEYISGEMSSVFIFLDITGLLCFGYSFLGRRQKKLLKQYSGYGLDENDAEEDFKSCSLYKGYAGISRRFLTIFSPAVVLPVEKIVWVFPKVSYTYHYMNCVYTGIQEEYSVVIYDDGGNYYILKCPEAMCKPIIDDITAAGRAVSSGYSSDYANLYSQSPSNFRNAVRNFSQPSKYQMPANEIK